MFTFPVALSTRVRRGTLSVMSKPIQARQISRSLAAWTLVAGFGFGVYRAYRWAEPSPASLNAVLSAHPVNNINLQLDGVAFENFANGAKNWSLWAGSIILERPPIGSAPNSLQSADIEDIRDGKLFPANQKGRKEEEKKEEEKRERSLRHSGTPALRHTPVLIHPSSFLLPPRLLP